MRRFLVPLTFLITVPGWSQSTFIAPRSARSVAIQYVTTNGRDSNDGQSLGTAKLTWTGACEALPGGAANPPTCGIGTIYYTDGIMANPVSGAGIWLFGSADPSYSVGASGWHRITGPIKSVCSGTGGVVVNNGSGLCLINGGSHSDNNHPLLWISSTNVGMEFDGLHAQYQGIQVELSVCSNGTNNGSCAVQNVVFQGVSTLSGNLTSGLGPAWLIGDGSFWIFVHDYNISGNANNSPAADNGAAVLLTRNTIQSGLIEFTDGGFNTGGIKYYAGNGSYLLVDGLTTTENNLEAAVWVTGGVDQATSTIVVQNVGVSDCNVRVAHCLVVRNDDSGYVHVSHISGPTMGLVVADSPQNIFPDSTANLVGPMLYEMNPNVNVEVVRSQGGNPAKMFSPLTTPGTNLVDIGTYTCGTCTIKPGIADPTDAGAGAINVTDTSGASGLSFTLSSTGGAVKGDTYVIGMWTRSTSGNGYPRGDPFEFILQGGGDKCNGSTTSYVAPTPLTKTENGWTHYVAICKLTTFTGAKPMFYLLTGNSTPVQAFGPVVFVMHGFTNEEVLNEALNIGSWTSTCTAGQTCDMTGPVPHTNTTQTWTQTQKFNSFATATNCAVNSASPATCGSAASGVFAVPPLTSSYTVNTTVVTSTSRIFLQPTSDNTGIPSAPSCATLAVAGVNTVSSRSAGKSFSINISPTKGTTCFYYWIVD